MTSPLPVAIDGPAASGKSTVARRLAEDWGLVMVNSGEMYRAVAWEVAQRGGEASCAEDCQEALAALKLTLREEEGRSVVCRDGVVMGNAELRSEAVNSRVSQVAAHPEVRAALVEQQRAFAQRAQVVMEGRDIGTVVFPETPFKLFIMASPEVRAARRAAEGLDDAITARDAQDAGRKTSPLRQAEGARVIDSSKLTLDETLAEAKLALRALGWPADWPDASSSLSSF